MKIIEILPWADWLALTSFIALWVGYTRLARVLGRRRPSLHDAMNRYRGYWMRQAAMRDPRMIDGLITQALSHTPSFFSSTSILVIGGLVALLGTTEKATEFLKEIPFAQATSVAVFEVKILLLVGVFVYAFFRFSWCMRQYTFVGVIIGAMPPPEDFASGKFDLNTYTDRAAELVSSAADTFHDGLRAYYFSFAAMCWFVSPLAMFICSVAVVAILYGREFHSDVLRVLNR
jgi:uncharacterized membrane protein